MSTVFFYRLIVFAVYDVLLSFFFLIISGFTSCVGVHVRREMRDWQKKRDFSCFVMVLKKLITNCLVFKINPRKASYLYCYHD